MRAVVVSESSAPQGPHILAPFRFFPDDAPAFHRAGSRYFSFARRSAMRHWCCDSADSRSHAWAIACAGESGLRGGLLLGVVVCSRCGLGRCVCVGDGESDDGICARKKRTMSAEAARNTGRRGGAYNDHEGVIKMG